MFSEGGRQLLEDSDCLALPWGLFQAVWVYRQGWVPHYGAPKPQGLCPSRGVLPTEFGCWAAARDPQGVRVDMHRSRDVTPQRHPPEAGTGPRPPRPRPRWAGVRSGVRPRPAGLRPLPPCSGCDSPSFSKGIMSGIFYVYDFIFETNQCIKLEEILSEELLSLPQTKLVYVFPVIFSAQPVLL